MNRDKNIICLVVMISALVAFGCNQPSGNNHATETSAIEKNEDYDAALDPFLVGGSSCKLFGDTLNMKMFACELKPGESGPWHSHPDHAIYVLQGGKLRIYPQGADSIDVAFEVGQGWIGGPIMDSAKNMGTTTVKFLEIDVYRPRVK